MKRFIAPMTAALLVSTLTPTLSTAQTGLTIAPQGSVANAPVQMPNFFPGIAIPNQGANGHIIQPGQQVGIPAQAQDCGASRLQDFVGQNVELFNSTGIQARVLGPNDFATLDYLPQRLNVSYSANNIINRVYCG